MTKVERTCPRCGLVFASEKLGALCPACLLRTTLDGITDEESTEAFWEDAEDFTEQPRPATRKFSHFDLLDEIGRGGMGVVYRARDLNTERLVALKVLQAHHLEVPDLVKRFRTEVRAVTSLDHPNILPVHEVGEYESIPFFSMKLATGGSVAEHLSSFLGKPRAAAALLAKVARGVQHAHEKGLLHRDLKPGNILLDSTGEPYVCDFGLAKWIDDDRRLTVTAAVLGTPHYIAPEQAAGQRDLTAAVDIYSLGAVLYELLTGRPPYVGNNVLDTLRRASERTPDRPSTIVAGIPRDLETICLKCLEHEPKARYATAGDVAHDLENWLEGRPIRARPSNATEQLWRWAKRNPLPAILFTSLIMAVFVIAIVATVSAVRIDKARRRAVAAEQAAQEKLYEALLAQAKASRLTGRAGQRFDALKAIAQAAKIHPSFELRNEAIAALSLIDLQIERKWVINDGGYVCTAFDDSLSTYAQGLPDGTVRMSSAQDGRVLQSFPGPAQPVQMIAHSGTGFVAARYADGYIQVLNTRTGRRVLQVDGPNPGHPVHNEYVNCAFSRDEQWVALQLPDRSVGIFSTETGEERNRTAPVPVVLAMSFSPDGRSLAIASDKSPNVLIWSTAEARLEEPIALPPNVAGAGTCAWSPDGALLAVGGTDYNIYAYETASRQLRGTFHGHRQVVMRVVFSHRGDLLVSTSRDKTIRLWNVRAPSEQVILTDYGGDALLRFSPHDDHLVATDLARSAILLQVGGIERPYAGIAPLYPTDRISVGSGLDFSPDDQFLATASWSSIELHNPATGQLLTRVSDLPREDHTLKFGPDGKHLWVQMLKSGLVSYRLAASPAGGIELVKESTNGATTGFTVGSRSIEPASDRVWLASPTQGSAILWDASSSKLLREIKDLPLVWDFSASPDGRWLAAGFPGAGKAPARVLDAATLKTVFESPLGASSTVTFSPDSSLVALNGYRGMGVWTTGDWKLLPLGDSIQTLGTTAFFSPDSRLVAIAVGDEIHLASTSTGETLAILSGAPDFSAGYRLRISGDGTHLAAQGLDNSLRIWDLRAMRQQLLPFGLQWPEASSPSHVNQNPP